MKFAVLALSALSAASAFVVQAPQGLKAAPLRADYLPAGTVESLGASPMGGGAMAPAGALQDVNDIWETANTVKVEGETLRTCSFDGSIDRVLVGMRTEGRPLNADVELWQGPDNTPQKMAVYIEDGSLRPFTCVLETPRDSNAVAIRNTGMLEFPLEAVIEPDIMDGIIPDNGNGKIIQGGALNTTPFPPSVQSVAIYLKTDGRPLNARIELLQGPNNKKQVMEVYTEDGLERPFSVVVATPGNGNVVRIVNTATIEYPLTASCEPYLVEEYDESEYGSGLLSWDS